MSVSYTKVNTWNTCPYKYKLTYIDGLECKFDERANNPLVLGTAIHEGIETRNIDKAIEKYKSKYSILDDNNEIEIYKMSKILPKAFEAIPEGDYEVKVSHPDGFVGYLDCLVKIDEGVYDLYDFKYSNNASSYKSSGQLHIYKYYYEKTTENKIRNMYYVLIPKIREVINEELDINGVKDFIDNHIKDVNFLPIEYDPKKVNQFFARKTLMLKDTEYQKRFSVSCNWCEFYPFCNSKESDLTCLSEASVEKYKSLHPEKF